MIARHRGDMRTHSRWRPAPPAAQTAEPIETDDAPQASDDPVFEPRPVEQPEGRPRRSRALVGVVTVIAVAAMAGHQNGSRGLLQPPLPGTPTQWVDQWTSAALDDPARVCGQLYASALAAVFRDDTGHSCIWYYSSAKSSSFRVRHVLQDGATAVIESQQLDAGRLGYFTTVLSRTRNGWQAVDMVPGGPVRPR